MAGPLGAAPGIMVGVGVGTAAAAAIEPLVEPGKQQAWSNHPNRILDAALMARLVAQGGVELAAAQADAARDGFAADKLDALVYLAQTVPGVGEALRILRRDPAFADLFTHSLVKQGIDPRYFPHLSDLQHERLDPAVIALAIVRGIIADPGFLPVGPPTAVGNVEAFPTSSIDALLEAAAAGWNRERLFVQTAISGRPMGPEAAAAATFRNILQRADFDRAISEGDVRNEWADAIFQTARQIPSAANFIEGHLRGWTTETAMRAGTAKHGMSDADTTLLFDIHGRPPSWHQVWIGLQRGGVYDGPIGDIDPAFLKALRESDLRPEWYNLLWHSRYNYPSPFVLRSLTSSGAITVADAEQVLKFEGYEPTFAAKIATAWGGSGPAAADPHVSKAQTHLWNQTHKSYIAEEIGDATATTQLATLGLDVAAQASVLSLWQAERALIRAQLSLKQLKDAYQGAVINPATGAAWTAGDVTQALLDRGYSANDAAVILAEW